MWQVHANRRWSHPKHPVGRRSLLGDVHWRTESASKNDPVRDLDFEAPHFECAVPAELQLLGTTMAITEDQCCPP